MATGDEYCGTWIFRELADEPPSVRRAYPRGKPLKIEPQEAHRDRFTLAWVDADENRHVLEGLTLSNGKLRGQKVHDSFSGMEWDITITHPEQHQLRGTVSQPESTQNPQHEGNLTGNWGADAPPPPVCD
jgi:hypothetical protein